MQSGDMSRTHSNLPKQGDREAASPSTGGTKNRAHPTSSRPDERTDHRPFQGQIPADNVGRC